MGKVLNTEAKAVATPSAITPPDSSRLVAARLAPPTVIAEMLPIVSRPTTNMMMTMPRMAVGENSMPNTKGCGTANQAAVPTREKSTQPRKTATR